MLVKTWQLGTARSRLLRNALVSLKLHVHFVRSRIEYRLFSVLALCMIARYASLGHRPAALWTVRRVLPTSRVQSELVKQHSWSECAECCSDLSGVLKNISAPELNLVCFDLNFVNRTQQYYAVLTTLAPHFSFYLRMAKQFLMDAGSEVKLQRKIVWRLEDNSTIQRTNLMALKQTGAAVVSHSSRLADSDPPLYTSWVPNFHFIDKKGFTEVVERIHKIRVDFKSRKMQIFWAGSTTGIPCDNIPPCTNTCQELLRVKLVRQFSNITFLKFALSSVVQWCGGSDSWLQGKGMIQPHVAEINWANHRGVLDIDGNVDAWGLRWRLGSGSVVFIVKSSYEHLYSNLLTDGVHYIGIDSDLSDLLEKTSIITSHEAVDVQYLENVVSNALMQMKELTYPKVVAAVASALHKDLASEQS
uniref:Glycosyl transferase CAP10 domain-containing protein n=1 Tax=Micromonas pusilla TaxID=38833 RepID=A0A7R9TLN2_MICPS|mmetsp:Transcript_3802/g.13116  ORF Transcript_3802/g.13116 Transcript_3802/m.13116 type:complete len:417 (+) Transcript_3802:310-1560(+)